MLVRNIWVLACSMLPADQGTLACYWYAVYKEKKSNSKLSCQIFLKGNTIIKQKWSRFFQASPYCLFRITQLTGTIYRCEVFYIHTSLRKLGTWKFGFVFLKLVGQVILIELIGLEFWSGRLIVRRTTAT